MKLGGTVVGPPSALAFVEVEAGAVAAGEEERGPLDVQALASRATATATRRLPLCTPR